jgi:hypothetical protein
MPTRNEWLTLIRLGYSTHFSFITAGGEGRSGTPIIVNKVLKWCNYMSLSYFFFGGGPVVETA